MSLQKQFLKPKKVYKVIFSLPLEAAKEAKEVKILGDFNQWDPGNGIPMELKNEEYSATVELEPGREYQFRYLVDNQTWINDLEADKYVLTPFGVENSVVIAGSI